MRKTWFLPFNDERSIRFGNDYVGHVGGKSSRCPHCVRRFSSHYYHRHRNHRTGNKNDIPLRLINNRFRLRVFCSFTRGDSSTKKSAKYENWLKKKEMKNDRLIYVSRASGWPWLFIIHVLLTLLYTKFSHPSRVRLFSFLLCNFFKTRCCILFIY